MPEFRVTVDRLRPGVFICLNRKWFDHPFLFNSFKIATPEQIATLRELGVEEVICMPEKSDVMPLPPGQDHMPDIKPAAPAGVLPERQDTTKLWQIKKDRIERLRARRTCDDKCEKQFQKSVTEVKGIMQHVETGSREAYEESEIMMRGIAASLMPEKDSAIQLMNTKFGNDNVFFHSLNVAVLSMMLGREYGLEADMMRLVGIGALFHDIGKSRIPRSILHKSTPLTRAEFKFYQLHPRYGIDILSKLDAVPEEAITAVYQHHERNDGKGFPQGLVADNISLPARIIAIANTYDNHCNKFDVRESMTPHEALAGMFSVQKTRFDENLLALFIQCLGVYPPGTIVQLSNGFTGMVISVNPRDSLHPSLLIYNPEIPPKEALIYDMTDDPDLKIEGSIRPSQLSPLIYSYLSPRSRVTYYVAESDSKQGEINMP